MAYTTTIEIFAADEASMQALLLSKSLLRAGENNWGPAPGVVLSIIGKVSLVSDANNAPLAGFFTMISIDPDIVPNGQATWDSLVANNKWTGAPIRQILGVGTFEADLIVRALNYAQARKEAGGWKGTGTNWYPFTTKSGAPIAGRLTRLMALATDADVVAADISLPRFGKTREAITTKAQATTLLAALNDAELKWDKAMWRLEKSVEDDPAYNWTTHNYPNGYTP
jgi:hypothetical protein